ncbi:hypothetical protein [Streptomyces anulatus]|uniref:hypothetical protein n=1 Tax=Streptomyces anulatus TaxID=1892 RepID=UPI00131EEF52|nr:hypothetical protein [Streptomyces anulatus]
MAVLSGTALADDIDAPYARAAAKVSANGTLQDSKNVEAVTRATGTGVTPQGVFCVRVSRRAVPDLPTAAIVGSLQQRGQLAFIGTPHQFCGNAAATITVITSADNGTNTDRPFTVAVL